MSLFYVSIPPKFSFLFINLQSINVNATRVVHEKVGKKLYLAKIFDVVDDCVVDGWEVGLGDVFSVVAD